MNSIRRYLLTRVEHLYQSSGSLGKQARARAMQRLQRVEGGCGLGLERRPLTGDPHDLGREAAQGVAVEDRAGDERVIGAVDLDEVHAAGGDATRLRTYAAQFRKPVWPGDTLVTQGWDVGGGKIAVVTTVKGRPDPVLTNAWAEIG